MGLARGLTEQIVTEVMELNSWSGLIQSRFTLGLKIGIERNLAALGQAILLKLKRFTAWRTSIVEPLKTYADGFLDKEQAIIERPILWRFHHQTLCVIEVDYCSVI